MGSSPTLSSNTKKEIMMDNQEYKELEEKVERLTKRVEQLEDEVGIILYHQHNYYRRSYLRPPISPECFCTWC